MKQQLFNLTRCSNYLKWLAVLNRASSKANKIVFWTVDLAKDVRNLRGVVNCPHKALCRHVNAFFNGNRENCGRSHCCDQYR